jgi:glycosyltransferase involved in cell wall biosynthesis
MQNKPLVTTLIPSYNSNKWIYELIVALLADEYPNQQLLISDDCSTDKTGEMWDQYLPHLVNKFKEVKLFHQKENLGSRRNTEFLSQHISEASKYVQILEADDKFYPSKVKTEVEYLESHPEIGLVYSNFDLELADGRLVKNGQDNFPWGSLPKAQGWVRNTLLSTNFILICTAMFRKDIYNLGFDFNLLNHYTILLCDYAAFLIMSKITQFGYIEECLSRYRFHPEGICNNPKTRDQVVADTEHIKTLASLGIF